MTSVVKVVMEPKGGMARPRPLAETVATTSFRLEMLDMVGTAYHRDDCGITNSTT